jgi:hypothetical protein
MRKSKYRRIVILVCACAAATVAFCAWPWGRTFPPLGPVTRVRVTAGSDNREVRLIDDPEQVRRIVEFVDGHRRGWGSGWFGPPVPQVTAEFYNGDEFKGHFGAGPGFFECQREDTFECKDCWGWQSREFLRLVGLPEFGFGG